MSLVPAPVADAWPVPPLLRASLGVHLLAAGAAAAMPQHAWWALAGVAANHAVITATGLWPRSHWLGPNVTRLPAPSAARGEVALTIDDGPDPAVTPEVLDLLDRHQTRATFFCIADRARRHAALTREIVARGHSVQNHSHRHRHTFSLLGPRGFADELARAQDVLADLTGQRPTCFRAPAGLRNPFLDPVLFRLGLRLVSWTRRGFDTRERDPQRVLARLTGAPMHALAGGDILLLHDGNAARTASGRAVLLDVLPGLLAALRSAGLHCVTLPEALPDLSAARTTLAA